MENEEQKSNIDQPDVTWCGRIVRWFSCIFKKQKKEGVCEPKSDIKTDRKISQKHLVYESKENKYYAIFYSEIYLSDIQNRDMFLYAPFCNYDTLKKDDSNTDERVFLELEMVKPIIKQFTDTYIQNNNEYKYWRIIMVQDLRNINILNSSNEIFDFLSKNLSLNDKQKTIRGIEKIIADRL